MAAYPLCLRLAQVLRSEQDLSTKRNAFQMLCNHAQDLATNYLLSQVRQVAAVCDRPCEASWRAHCLL